MMPDVDGFAVLTAFKALPIFPPTVVLSNLSQEEDVDKVKKLGAKEYFVKSNTPIRDIVAYVIKLLHESPE
jgi:PleD family two-component response regulator